MNAVLEEIEAERQHQDKKWGGPDHDELHGPYSWVIIITNYLAKSSAGFIENSGTPESRMRNFRYNMVKVAALAVAAIEAVDRKRKVLESYNG